jgi:endoglucanase
VIAEGNAGTQYALVSVNLNAPSKQTVTVNYATADDTARAGTDYGAVSGRLTFARGETSKTVAVPVYGDRLAEADESFTVNLSGAQRAKIGDGRGVVTVVEDEPRISVGDAAGTVVYSAGGTAGTTLYFTVSLAAAYDQAVTVNYATADGTATAGVDYLAASGALTFAPGETSKTVAVEVIGNDSGLDEWFSVNLAGASGNARIVDGQGTGTIHYYVEQPPDCGCECTPDSPYYPNC